MEKAIGELHSTRLKALQDGSDSGGFELLKDQRIKVSRNVAASYFKIIGLDGKRDGKLSNETLLKVLRRIVVSDDKTIAAFANNFHLTEQCVLLSKMPNFRFSQYSKVQRDAIWETLGVFGDEQVFAGLPYGESAEAIRKRLLAAK